MEMIALMLSLAALLGAGTLAAAEAPSQIWDLDALMVAPETHPAPEGFAEEGVQALFYDGLPWQGNPTRVFAYMGVPEVAAGESVPGMVLIHGGGGTAYAKWVRMWNERGYAAIAMDTCGATPGEDPREHPRHDFSGPPGWGAWAQMDWPREDQWQYHAIADVLLAHSLLAAQPGVDPGRIGVTGISWGGYLTSFIAGVDPRYRFAIPVYGCGFYADTHFGAMVDRLTDEQGARWYEWWDPMHYLPSADLPMLWVNGTNDFAYWLPGWQQSYRAAPGPHTLSVRVRMPHGHGPGWAPEEIYLFADSILRGGEPLARIVEQQREGMAVSARVECPVALERAELVYTCATGIWPERQWEAAPAEIDGETIRATLPEATAVYFLNVIDARGLVVSTEYEDLAPAQ